MYPYDNVTDIDVAIGMEMAIIPSGYLLPIRHLQ